jgi:uncharacterized protein involved in outer membrane biogenesis
MKRLLKGISVLAGLVLVTVVTALVIVTSFVSPNQSKPLIVSQFKQFTGFEMTIPGDLSWSFYPHLGVEAGQVTINDPGVFSATLKNLVLHVNLGPLLQKQLDFSKASIGALKLNHLDASNISAKIKFKNQILSLENIRADLYQGHLNVDTTVSLQQAAPTLHIVGDAKGIDVAGFLKGLSGKTSKLQFNGRGDVSWNLTTQGKKTNELLGQLNGTGRFTVSKGSIKGINLAYFVNTAVALINKEPLPSGEPMGETEFGQITGTAIVRNGVITTNDLALEAPLYTAKATGTVDLVNQTLDYHVDVNSKVVDQKVVALAGKTVPVRISGRISDPSVTLDTLALMKAIGKEQLQKVGQEIQKALPDKANNIIRNLFH